MLQQPEQDFIGLIFHELAHQRLYVQDDSAFNEAFATAVELEGQRRWQIHSGQQPAADDDTQRSAVEALLRSARAELRTLYASNLDTDAKRAGKQQILADLTRAYADLTAEWRAANLQRQPYAQLFRQGLNNASLAALATYDDYVPGFTELLRQCGGWLACFYFRAEALAALPPDQRKARMQTLLVAAEAGKK
jgi:predicted aminopeptidase